MGQRVEGFKEDHMTFRGRFYEDADIKGRRKMGDIQVQKVKKTVAPFFHGKFEIRMKVVKKLETESNLGEVTSKEDKNVINVSFLINKMCFDLGGEKLYMVFTHPIYLCG